MGLCIIGIAGNLLSDNSRGEVFGSQKSPTKIYLNNRSALKSVFTNFPKTFLIIKLKTILNITQSFISVSFR